MAVVPLLLLGVLGTIVFALSRPGRRDNPAAAPAAATTPATLAPADQPLLPTASPVPPTVAPPAPTVPATAPALGASVSVAPPVTPTEARYQSESDGTIVQGRILNAPFDLTQDWEVVLVKPPDRRPLTRAAITRDLATNDLTYRLDVPEALAAGLYRLELQRRAQLPIPVILPCRSNEVTIRLGQTIPHDLEVTDEPRPQR